MMTINNLSTIPITKTTRPNHIKAKPKILFKGNNDKVEFSQSSVLPADSKEIKKLDELFEVCFKTIPIMNNQPGHSRHSVNSAYANYLEDLELKTNYLTEIVDATKDENIHRQIKKLCVNLIDSIPNNIQPDLRWMSYDWN